MSKLPVIAAIPAHNAEKTLRPLIQELVAQGYDGVYVLDDKSSDNSLKIAGSYGKNVKVIAGQKNVGTGANRNRIIGQTPDCIIHFLDADVRLLSENTPEIIRALKWTDDTAYYGGLLRNPNGGQNPYNFGPRPSLATTITSSIQYAIWMVSLRSAGTAKILRKLFGILLKSWPDIFAPPKPTQTFWTAESNMIIRSKTFEAFGGYDPVFRYGEINDLALRFEKAGYKTLFTPEIDVIHASMDNIFQHKGDKWTARKQLIKKYGRLMYWSPGLWKKFGPR